MHLSFHCPSCGKHSESTDSSARTVCCDACDWSRTPPQDDFDEDVPRACLVCGNGDLWRQKDFSQRLGIAIVILGAVLSSVAWSQHMPLTALGILLLFALADLVLFIIMPDVLVCYRCQARHRGVGADSGHGGFNHELAERYRQEKMRVGRTN